MTLFDSIGTLKFICSYGYYVFDHLTADTAGLLGSELAVVAILQIDADLTGSFHFELVQGLLGLRYYGTCHDCIHSFFLRSIR